MIQAQVNVKLTWNIPPSGQGRFWQRFKKEANDASKNSAKFYKTHLKHLISVLVGRSATGRVIKRSDPGEPPRLDTGELYRSIEIEQERRNLYTMIYSHTEYAEHLEHGTIKVAARPAWLPAFLAQWQIMADYITLRLAHFINTYIP